MTRKVSIVAKVSKRSKVSRQHVFWRQNQIGNQTGKSVWFQPTIYARWGGYTVSRFCKEFCNAENPHYPGLVDADGENLGNSEAAEQCFAKLVNFGSTAMNMSCVNCRHYIHFMAETLNEVLTRRLERCGKQLTPFWEALSFFISNL